MYLIKKIEFYKNKLFSYLDKELDKYKQVFYKYSPSKKEFFNLYKNFLFRGKAIRGSLVFLTNEIFDKSKINNENLYLLASFFEIIHSNFLIHDDFMDKDKNRRGDKTINFYFEEKVKNNSTDPIHLSNSLAVNLGDIGFFIAFNFFNKIKTDTESKNKIYHYILTNYIKVALAQSDDIYYSYSIKQPSLQLIKKIYLSKTAYYTFNLPVIATLMLKNNPLWKNKKLEKILTNLGFIFQITDDLIGFLSDKTGKDIGSDIRENKKTIIRYFLFEELRNNPLKEFFGKKNLTISQVKQIREFYKQSTSRKKIEKLISQIKKQILSDLKKTEFPEEFCQLTEDFINYLINRNK